MRTSMFLALATILMAVSPAFSQTEKDVKTRTLRNTGQLGVGVEPMIRSKCFFLEYPQVLEELGVTDAQKELLDKAMAERKLQVEREFKEHAEKKLALSKEGNRDADLAFDRMWVEAAKKLTKPDEQPVMKILHRDQVKRLEQIQIRAMGYLAFTLPEITDKFAMEPDQVEQIAALVSQGRKSIFGAAVIPVNASTDFTSMSEADSKRLFESKTFQSKVSVVRDKVAKAHTATLREINNVLNRPQQGTYKLMIGRPFDFSKLSPDKTQQATSAPAVDKK